MSVPYMKGILYKDVWRWFKRCLKEIKIECHKAWEKCSTEISHCLKEILKKTRNFDQKSFIRVLHEVPHWLGQRTRETIKNYK